MILKSEMHLIINYTASNLHKKKLKKNWTFPCLMPLFFLSQVRVVLLAAAPVDRLFVHTGGEDERDQQLLDDLGLSGVKRTSSLKSHL